MRKIRSPLIVTIAAGLLAGTTIGVAAQEDASSGFAFKRLAPLTEHQDVGLGDIAELPSGLIGVAGGGSIGDFVWTSADGGETWTESPFDQEGAPHHFVTFEDVFVAVNRSDPYATTQTTWVYTSPDGVDWALASTLDGSVISSLITTPDGLAMIGLDFREADGWGSRLAGYPSMWQSSDATTWDLHEITTPLYVPEDEDPLGLGGLARSDDGEWLATGVTNVFDAEQDSPPSKIFHVFHSVDGAEWTRATAPVPDTTPGLFGTMTRPVWTESGFLVNAFTEDDDAPHGLFLSADGSTWEQVADIPGPDIPVMASDGTIVVGFRLPFAEGDGGPPSLLEGSPVYVSPDGRTWEHPSPLILEQGHANAVTFTADGRLLVAGGDISGCREFFCVFDPGNGTVPTVWLGEPN